MRRGSMFRYQEFPNSRYASLKSSQQNLTLTLKSKLTTLKSLSKRKQTEQELLHNRRQNYLNTFYNIRRNKLIQITKENRKIHKRINQQKSYYSRRNLSISYQSNCSKSQHSFSRQSSRKGTPSRSRKTSREQISIKNQSNAQNKKISSLATIQAQNVCKINEKNIVKFSNMISKNSKQNSNKVLTLGKSLKPIPFFNSKSKKLNHNFPSLRADNALIKIVEQITLNPLEKKKRIIF